MAGAAAEPGRGRPFARSLDLRSRAAVWVLLRGMAMGVAEVVPGVSGGTIAYVTGIYERLLHAINACSSDAVGLLRTRGLAAAWARVDGNFLAALFGGMAISVFAFASGMGFLLHRYPIAVWAFFFGLIFASSWFMVFQVRSWAPLSLASLVTGVAVGVIVSSAIPVELEATLPILFFAGAIAVCAWILPGVSGSYVMLIFGLYVTVIDAISGLDLVRLGVLAAGCITGLLSFARLLEAMFRQYREATLALLTGFMLGSLVRVWPWKYTLSYQLGEAGRRIPLVQEPVMPVAYRELTGDDPQIGVAILLCVLAIGLVGGLAFLARNREGAS